MKDGDDEHPSSSDDDEDHDDQFGVFRPRETIITGMSRQHTAEVFEANGPVGAAELVRQNIPGPIEAAYRAVDSVVESSKPIQITWRPERSLTVRYRVVGTGHLDGEHQVVVFIGDAPEGAFVVDGPEGQAVVWVVPHDPWLPGMASALDVDTVNDLLRSLGASDDAKGVRLRSYRPGRRAVVEVSAGGSSIFLKVVCPDEAPNLHDKHRYLSATMPVPDSLGLAPDLGIVAMRALPGRSLREMLKKGEPDLPHVSAIAALIASLPEPADDTTSRSPIARAPQMAEFLARLVPDQRSKLDSIVSAIGKDPSAERVPVHGDFHEAQILVVGDTLVGLIDVDGFGWGRPGDDPATMLGHLGLLAPRGRRPQTILRLANDLNQVWDRLVDPLDLRNRTAAVALGLATGPFRVQLGNWPDATRSRIETASTWVNSAKKVADTRT